MELFDFLNNITMTKEPLSEEQLKGYSPYMINRFVSMTEVFVPLVAELNKYDIPADVHHRFMQNKLPKRKQYFKYIKGKKDTSAHEIDCLCKYFEIGKKDAAHYLNILTNDQIKEIVDKFRTK
jgi:hypothetical protein